MASQRNHLFLLLVASVVMLRPLPSWPAPTPAIVLPDPLAIELPAGTTSVGPDDEPLKALIATAHANVGAEVFRVTATLPRPQLGAGVWRVIWSAYAGNVRDRPVARRESFLFVLPHGMTPVAMSGKVDATSGNNALHIARDAGGFVHMVWTDSWRPGARDGALYRRGRILPDGSTRFETGVLDLGQHSSNWTAMPAVTAVGNTVHFAWQTEGTLRYRTLTRNGEAWHWSDEVDTKVPSPGRDTGPSMLADANAVHILTPAGIYVTSDDGGRTWVSEQVPFGEGLHVKTASLGMDSEGRALAAASIVVSGPGELSDDHGRGGYWTLGLLRRVAQGKWERLASPVDGRPEWAAPEQSTEDVLCDWVSVLGDPAGGIHLAWHGTAVSRIYGHDHAYYAWRAPDGSWRTPISLRDPNLDVGIGSSFAPSLTLDGDRILTLSFFDRQVRNQDRGYDSEFRLFRDGVSPVAALPVTRFVAASFATGEPRNALSTWFPGAAPSLFRGADGKIWADILATLVPTGVTSPALIVWERLDLTDWLKTAGGQ